MAKFNINNFKKPILIVASILLCIIISFSIWLGINTQPNDPDETSQVRVEIRPGASIEEVAALLGSKELIKNPLAFSVYARLSFSKIEAGAHFVSSSMSAADIIRALSNAENGTYNLTILPETTLIEIKESLLSYGFSEADIDKAFSKQYDHPLLVTKPTNHDLEGYIFPDTYEMHTDDSVEELLLKTFDNLYEKMRADGSLTYMSTRDISIHETLTLASIVAREAPDIENQKIISGVFWNRLDNGISLGADATFQYAYMMGYCDTNTPACDSIYNTRIYTGLPPGPISNMRYDTIQAVLHPTDNDYFYFVAGDDGRIHYSRTEAEHLQNTANYCTVLCQ